MLNSKLLFFIFVFSIIFFDGLSSRGLAQIASPNNAGGNSGNNAEGSSTTAIGTPRFVSLKAVLQEGLSSKLESILSSSSPVVKQSQIINPDQNPDLVLINVVEKSEHNFTSLLDEIERQYLENIKTFADYSSVTNLQTGSVGRFRIISPSFEIPAQNSQPSPPIRGLW